MSSFNIALTGLSADATALDIVGNNLANLNTTGFKGSNASFRDLMSDLSGAPDLQVGGGVAGVNSNRLFTQGSIQTTQGQFDAAVQGDGFFIVRDSSGNLLYTRAGNFKVDANGDLLTQSGEKVQGWSAVNGAVDPSGAIGSISISAFASQTPSATTTMSLNANLNSAAAVGTSFSTPIQVVDSLGVTHTLTVTFAKTAANSWSYDVGIPSGDLSSSSSTGLTSLGTGTLTFDSTGKLTDPAAGSPINIPASGFASGAADLSIDWSLYTPDGTGLITQYGQDSAASSTSQNGVQAGQLQSVDLSDSGKIMAHYSSGSDVVIGQLALASIANPESLVDVGNNNYDISAGTAAPVIGAAGTGGRGQIVGGALESSNVDMAREFTNLIVYQRGYQANSKVITTQDQLTQDVLNMMH